MKDITFFQDVAFIVIRILMLEQGRFGSCFAARRLSLAMRHFARRWHRRDVSNPTRWLILTGSGYACAKVAVCPEQPSHFNSHPPQPPRANVVVVAKPTWTTALRAANVIIVRHVSHLMKNEKKILQRGFRTRTHPTYTAKREYHSIPASTKLNLVELLRNTFVFSRLLFPWVCYLRVAKSPFFINCKCRVLLFFVFKWIFI